MTRLRYTVLFLTIFSGFVISEDRLSSNSSITSKVLSTAAGKDSSATLIASTLKSSTLTSSTLTTSTLKSSTLTSSTLKSSTLTSSTLKSSTLKSSATIKSSLPPESSISSTSPGVLNSTRVQSNNTGNTSFTTAPSSVLTTSWLTTTLTANGNVTVNGESINVVAGNPGLVAVLCIFFIVLALLVTLCIAKAVNSRKPKFEPLEDLPMNKMNEESPFAKCPPK